MAKGGYKYIRTQINPVSGEKEYTIGERVLVIGDEIRFPGEVDGSRVCEKKGVAGLHVETSGNGVLFKIKVPLSGYVGLRAVVEYENNPQGTLPGVG
jgi:hypothetical protein